MYPSTQHKHECGDPKFDNVAAVTVKVMTILLVVFAACGPGGRGDDDDGNGSGGLHCQQGDPCATVTGRVWAPKWAPGQVPAGQEIPIFGALVYVSSSMPQPIPDHVYCEACVDAPEGAATTDHDGSFSLSVPPGHYFFVIQKGQFRLVVERDLQSGAFALGPSDTTLPSTQDKAHGAWIQRIAISYGN